jgi:glycosyltransferase involved in cell wall biosynthesis
MLDRRVLRWMDGVVCVSEAQAQKVRRAGVSAERIVVIHNAVDPSRFAPPKSEYRQQLLSLFPAPPAKIVGAAGRLSPEKGFHVLVDAASDVARRDPSVGFVLFGEGPQRDVLARQIETKGLQRQFILAGFHADLDQYFPQLDLFVLPSFTEGLPNVVLEAFASRVPVVATRAGGTPEVVTDRETGYLVTPGDCHGLADRMSELLHDDSARLAMGQRGRRDVEERFSFVAQAQAYQHLFQGAVGKAPMVDTVAAAQPLE